MRRGALTFMMAVMVAACADKAKEPYDRCTQLHATGELQGAVDACQAAIMADSTSKSGQAAATQLDDIKRQLDQQKIAAEAKAKADEAARQAAAEAMKARWPTMPTTLARKIRDQAASDLMHARSTSAMDVITAEIGKPVGTYDGGLSSFYVWGQRLGSAPSQDELKGAPFTVRTTPGLTCGDYAPNMIEFYASGQRIWPD